MAKDSNDGGLELGLHLGRAGRGDGPVRDVAAIDGDLYAGRPGVVDEPVLDQRVGGLVEPAGVGGSDPDENHPADGPEGVADRDNHRSQFQRGLHVDARQGEQGLAHEHQNGLLSMMGGAYNMNENKLSSSVFSYGFGFFCMIFLATYCANLSSFLSMGGGTD
eukprot:CAMPEP_0116990516 /NCGR_PEP_ID=MMETSP0467-20121206/65528_1 /TAXON_ID=283647 /ORGANISM="Mesodinium pulex, Strain SPMC105" /LENGTH=162 /DNA_ID=CAMNT_0004687301 /DNA_START=313 /DNA_END=801 /DNA_ORIENTATION=-